MNIKGLVTVRDRFDCTVRCLDALISTAGDRIDLFVFDDRTAEEFDDTFSYYQYLLKYDQIHLICNRDKHLPNVFWGKSYAIHQIMAWFRAIYFARLAPSHFFICDNDIVVKPGWLDACLTVLHSSEAKKHNVKIVCPWNNPDSDHEVLAKIQIDKYPVAIKRLQGGGFWFAQYMFWHHLELPPFGKADAVADDIWIWDQMQSKPVPERFAILDDYAEMLEQFGSAREKFVGPYPDGRF